MQNYEKNPINKFENLKNVNYPIYFEGNCSIIRRFRNLRHVLRTSTINYIDKGHLQGKYFIPSLVQTFTKYLSYYNI